MGKHQRDKGARAERELCNLLREAGYDAKRVPLSGACDGFKGDVIVTIPNDCHKTDGCTDALHFCKYPPGNLICEVKVRADGFKQLYSWLDGSDLLMVRADRKEWLVIQRLTAWLRGGGEG